MFRNVCECNAFRQVRYMEQQSTDNDYTIESGIN